jgi:hypothetical protein
MANEFLIKKNSTRNDILVSSSKDMNRILQNYSSYNSSSDTILIHNRPMLMDVILSQDLQPTDDGEPIPIETLCLVPSLQNKVVNEYFEVGTETDYDFINNWRLFKTEGYKVNLQLSGVKPPDFPANILNSNQIIIGFPRYNVDNDTGSVILEYYGVYYCWLDPKVFSLDRDMFSNNTINNINAGAIFDVATLKYLMEMDDKTNFSIWNNDKYPDQTFRGCFIENDILTNNQLVMQASIAPSVNTTNADSINLVYDTPAIMNVLFSAEGLNQKVHHWDFTIKITANTGLNSSLVLPIRYANQLIDAPVLGLPPDTPTQNLLFDNILKCTFSGSINRREHNSIQVYSNFITAATSAPSQYTITDSDGTFTASSAPPALHLIPGSEFLLDANKRYNIICDVYLHGEDVPRISDPSTFRIQLSQKAYDSIARSINNTGSFNYGRGVIMSWDFTELVSDSVNVLFGYGINSDLIPFAQNMQIGHLRIHCAIDTRDLDIQGVPTNTGLYIYSLSPNIQGYYASTQKTIFE